MSSTLREPLHLRQNETDGEHETPVGVALSANRCHSTRGATGLSHHFALVPFMLYDHRAEIRIFLMQLS